MREKLLLIKCGYSMEVSGSDNKKMVWEVTEYQVVGDSRENDYIGLQGFYFNLIE